jgi:hypothetical protein
MSNKKKAFLWMLWAIFNFIIFAIDIEKDRDFFTWVWLFSTVICLMTVQRLMIIQDKNS